MNITLSEEIQSNPVDEFADCPTLSDLEILKPISKGAFGVVYLCRRKSSNDAKHETNKHSGNVYAMKVMNKKDILDKNKIRDVYEEREILSSVRCPFIVSFHYFVQSSNYACFVMEYMVGGDLKNLLLCMRWFNDYMAAFYTAEAALAIDYLHKLNIIHRDIKPDNMLISLTGHLKLTDFGLSQTATLKRMNAATEVFTPRGRKTMTRSQVLLRSFSSQIHFNRISEFDTEEEQEMFNVVGSGTTTNTTNDDIYADNRTIIKSMETIIGDCTQRTAHSESFISVHQSLSTFSTPSKSVDAMFPAMSTPPARIQPNDECSGMNKNHELDEAVHSSCSSQFLDTGCLRGVFHDVEAKEPDSQSQCADLAGTLFIPLFIEDKRPYVSDFDGTAVCGRQVNSDAMLRTRIHYSSDNDKILEVVNKEASFIEAKSDLSPFTPNRYIVRPFRGAKSKKKEQKVTPQRHVSASMTDTIFNYRDPNRNGPEEMIRGTPDYFAPELLCGAHRTHTKAIDWWALGCCLFEFLYGCSPFWDQTIEDVINNIRNIRVEYDDSVSMDGNFAIKRFLTSNPESRVNLEDMKNLPFFKRINFDDLHSMQAPFVPLPHDSEDVTNFRAVNGIRGFFEKDL